VLHNPLTEREIWLVLGNMLSAEKFYSGLESDDPAPETLQLNHLLQTTIAAAGERGRQDYRSGSSANGGVNATVD
jgi:hypothetical protein